MRLDPTLLRLFGLSGTVLACVLGLVFKAERYSLSFIEHPAEDAQRLAAFLGQTGWIGVATSGPPRPFPMLTFAKAGCGHLLVVAPLGTSLELQDEVRLALGSDVAFIAGGQAGAAPSLLGAQLTGLARAFSPPTDAGSALGFLAVSPAPPAAERMCAPPSLASWRRL